MGDFKTIVRNNGPHRLEGEGITICDQEGRVYGLAGRTVVSLCRCGQSANKPFCDGMHNKVGFQSACQAHELPPPQPKASS
jgi:CDGSH-type Zn-finger protein